MIELVHLSKKYGNFEAVHDINVKLSNGHIYGLLGLNGAGKSTIMNMMTGCLAPTEGSVRINGFDIFRDPIRAKKCIGYLPEIPPLYTHMTIASYLAFVAEARGVASSKVRDEVQEAMIQTAIAPFANRLIRTLSKGFKQRVGIASTLVGHPDIVVLDEPTVGLDPVQMVEIRELILSLGQKQTVVVSSHILAEMQEVCDHILLVDHGQLLADAPMEEILIDADGNPRTLEDAFITLTGHLSEDTDTTTAMDNSVELVDYSTEDEIDKDEHVCLIKNNEVESEENIVADTSTEEEEDDQ